MINTYILKDNFPEYNLYEKDILIEENGKYFSGDKLQDLIDFDIKSLMNEHPAAFKYEPLLTSREDIRILIKKLIIDNN